MSDERQTKTVDELKALVGQEVGVSRWFEISQERINQFADITEDWQFIHIDPERAKAETPFGGAIAHGFLTLSMGSAMAYDALPKVAGAHTGVNYGFEKVRFLNPVLAGAKIRGRFTLIEADERKAGEVTFKYGLSIEIDGVDKPALAAEWLTRQYFGA